jgi:hypothetical protein
MNLDPDLDPDPAKNLILDPDLVPDPDPGHFVSPTKKITKFSLNISSQTGQKYHSKFLYIIKN